ncbi:hypothetical protein Tco_1249759 [Tanacetum coccineum]
MGGYKYSQLKGKSYEEIQGLIICNTEVTQETKSDEIMQRMLQKKKQQSMRRRRKNLLGKMEEKDMYVYKLTRADGSSSYHEDTQAFLRRLDRQNLNDLYSCGVHTLFMDGKPMEINMLVEKKYPLIKELLEKMLNLQLEAEEESTMAFEIIKFIKSLLEE